MPVWKDDCPKELQKIPVHIETVQYVKAYESDYYCLRCGMYQKVRRPATPREKKKTTFEKFLALFKKKVVEVKIEPARPVECCYCKTAEHFITEGALCPECKLGMVTTETMRCRKF